MSKLPRNVSGGELTKALRHFGYEFERQVGSHIRLKTEQNGQHHVTIPNHNPLKTGTLSGILGDVANHIGLTKEQIVEKIF